MGRKVLFQILSAAWLIAGCQTIPEYPVKPSISFGSVSFKETPTSDTIFLTINYKDGDGDLGLSAEDRKLPAYADSITVNDKKELNYNAFNIFPILLKKNGEKYDTILLNGYNGIFPRLRKGDVGGPIEGSILYKITSYNFYNEDSSIAKIRVRIQDRALHKSNSIETPPFPVIYR